MVGARLKLLPAVAALKNMSFPVDLQVLVQPPVTDKLLVRPSEATTYQAMMTAREIISKVEFSRLFRPRLKLIR